MVSAELIATLQELSRADKLYIMQILISELAQQETDLIKPDGVAQSMNDSVKK